MHKYIEEHFEVKVTYPLVNEGRVLRLLGYPYAITDTMGFVGRILDGEITDVPLATEYTRRKHMTENKSHSCPFCGELKKNKMYKHLETMHEDQQEVIDFMALPPGSDQRKNKIAVSMQYINAYEAL